MIYIQTLLTANECVMRHLQSFKANDLIPSSALADILTVPEATLRHWRNSGVGPPFYRIGKHVRYRLSDVEAWLQDRRT